MLYKEWRHTRLKFGLMLVLYILAGILVNTVFAPKPKDLAGHSVFQFWVIAALFATFCAGVIGGVDAVAEESDRETIGFLLAQPLTRRRIFTIKVLLNSLALTVALTITSLAVFFTQFIPRTFTANVWDNEKGGYMPVPVADPVVPPVEGFCDIVAILAFGVMLVCLSAAVSVFVQNTIQAIVYTSAILLVGLVITLFCLNGLSAQGRFSLNDDTMFRLFYEASLPAFGFLAVLSAGIYLLGVQSFRRKDF